MIVFFFYMEKNKMIEELAKKSIKHNYINPEFFSKYEVKKGLRNEDGTGVLVGLTNIGDVHGYIIDEGEKVPVEGRLRYRGIDVRDLFEGFIKDKRKGFEEIVYLILLKILVKLLMPLHKQPLNFLVKV